MKIKEQYLNQTINTFNPARTFDLSKPQNSEDMALLVKLGIAEQIKKNDSK